MLRLVDLPHVVEAEQHFGSPARADVIERGEEDDLFRRGRLQRRPGLRHAPYAQLAQHCGVAPERVVRHFPAFHLLCWLSGTSVQEIGGYGSGCSSLSLTSTKGSISLKEMFRTAKPTLNEQGS